ncbi:MAG: hypothetical protein MI924_24945 [Chloroflexales bacterium]|nr:hypothetical protein [Chloroflexales bacterium]
MAHGQQTYLTNTPAPACLASASRMPSAAFTDIDTATAKLAAWMETMRGPGGYGGPVAHWWQQSLVYTGPGLDWRYEGIIAGYLNLWERSGDARWLHSARRAGDDLVVAQTAEGHYPASTFEINPATAGTPHEAACDNGLLLLALALRANRDESYKRYAVTAEHNLRRFLIGRLWDVDARAFRDSPHIPSFVPNKAATICETLFLYAELSGDSRWVEAYALPTLDRIIAHQVCSDRGDNGAIAQNTLGRQRIEKYFPIYIARCIPALVRGYYWTNAERYIASAQAALGFIARQVYPDGSLPAVVYPGRRVNRYPAWIAPLGDVLRAADILALLGIFVNFGMTRQWLLAGQDASGGFQTAHGFAAHSTGRLPARPDVRDVLHVAGWCDKAFRYLAGHTGNHPPTEASAAIAVDCIFRGKPMRFVEDTGKIEITTANKVYYRWQKGSPWAEIASPEFWLR